MTPPFVSWQALGAPTPQYAQPSPNLVLLARHLRDTFELTNLGIYNRRPIRGGTAWSSHAFGAALDAGYSNQTHVETVVLPWLIEHATQLGVQRIHHYKRNQYWQAGKGWVNRTPGTGGNWLHIEVHPTRWADDSLITHRLTAAPVSSAPRYPGKPLKRGSTGKAVQHIQTVLGITSDGKYGPKTEQAVIEFQTAHNLKPDGIVGPKTWAALNT